MMILVLATENRDKGKELRAILQSGIQSEVQTLADYPQFKLPPEDGSTYRENAVVKAMSVANQTGQWAMGDDSGLEVDALEGAPGLYSARFAGVGASYADNRKKVLALLGDLPDEKRTARFICTIAIAAPDGAPHVVEGVCEGRITRHEQGMGGFGYDPIFWADACGKTLAELSSEEKQQISHRGHAVRAAMETLKRLFQHPPSP
jgi:XTP/dITP diphosphohydrolase